MKGCGLNYVACYFSDGFSDVRKMEMDNLTVFVQGWGSWDEKIPSESLSSTERSRGKYMTNSRFCPCRTVANRSVAKVPWVDGYGVAKRVHHGKQWQVGCVVPDHVANNDVSER